MENQKEQLGFDHIKEIFSQELARIISLNKKRKTTYPPLSQATFDLLDLNMAFEQLEFDPRPALAASRKFFQDLFANPTANSLEIPKLFPSSQEMCLITLPLNDSLLPLSPADPTPETFPQRLIIAADGETFGFGNHPAYLFPSFPQEIQSLCTFRTPNYTNSAPSKEEIETLQTDFFHAFDNVENLLVSKLAPTINTAIPPAIN